MLFRQFCRRLCRPDQATFISYLPARLASTAIDLTTAGAGSLRRGGTRWTSLAQGGSSVGGRLVNLEVSASVTAAAAC